LTGYRYTYNLRDMTGEATTQTIKRSDFKLTKVTGAGGRPKSVYVCPKHGCWLNSSQVTKHLASILKYS
jgi:hypothetical protein